MKWGFLCEDSPVLVKKKKKISSLLLLFLFFFFNFLFDPEQLNFLLAFYGEDKSGFLFWSKNRWLRLLELSFHSDQAKECWFPPTVSYSWCVCLECDNSVTHPAAVSERARKGNPVYILAVLYLCYQASSCQGLNSQLFNRHACVWPKTMGVWQGLNTTSLPKLGWWGCHGSVTEQHGPGMCLHESARHGRFV